MDTLKSFFKKIKWETLVTALLAIVIGVLFIVFPENSGNVICYVAGGIFVFLGAFLMIRHLFSGSIFGSYMLIVSILLIVVGVLCLVKQDMTQNLITIIFGAFIVVNGLVDLQMGVDCAKMKVKGSWTLFVMSILLVGLGISVMFGTFDFVMIYCGISLIVDGICDIVTTLVFSSHVKKAEKTLKNYINEIEQ